MSFLYKLLDMLRGGSTSTSLKETSSLQQRNNGKHLSRSTQLNNREEIREVVTQHIARHRDGVLSTLGTLTSMTHGIGRSLDRDL